MKKQTIFHGGSVRKQTKSQAALSEGPLGFAIKDKRLPVYAQRRIYSAADRLDIQYT